MASTAFKTLRRTPSRGLRVDRAAESRCALALTVLLGLATMSVLVTTSALSQHRATERFEVTSRSSKELGLKYLRSQGSKNGRE